MEPRQQQMLHRLVERAAAGAVGAACCFAPSTDPEVVDAFQSAVFGPEFQLQSRWTNTALGAGASLGDPVTLTYGFVPDGTTIPGAVEPTGPSTLQASFDAAFGGPATWRALFDQVFQRWGEVSGITYVYEPNDDGATLGSAPGVAGVRADLRIAGQVIDGPSSILAYNFFPPGGDMVLDIGDLSSYSNPAGNYLFLRNVIAHEHGHGMGLAHVCPTSGTKLMEPFINLGFDGPRTDDILGSQRLYGDPNEPNDIPALATDLGPYAGPVIVENVSLDDGADVDVYRLGLPANVELSISVTPVGGTYNQGPQAGGCGNGSPFPAGAQIDLAFDLIAPDGQTVIASVDAVGTGGTEALTGLFVPGAADYHLAVRGAAQAAVQLYRLSITATPGTPPPFTLSIPGSAPALLPPDRSSPLIVTVSNGAGAPDPASAVLRWRIDQGPWSTSPLQALASDTFLATLPAAPCFASVEYRVEVAPLGGGSAQSLPLGAGSFTAEASLGGRIPVFSDGFDTDLGWTVSDDAALVDGTWERGIPAGGGDRGDPPAAFGGGGFAFVTDNADGNSDVDGGTTSLISPLLDLSAHPDAVLSFRLWFDNVFGNNPGTDPFVAEISDDGGASWVPLLSYNVSVDQWVPFAFRIGDFVAPTSAVRVRFSASDPPPGAVVEAGLDSFLVEVCADPGNPPALTAVGASGAFSQPLLLVNGSAGGIERSLDVLGGTAFRLEVAAPGAAPAGHLVFGLLGVPGAGGEVSLGPGLGTFVFTPCALPGGNPGSFLLADSLQTGLCPGALPATAAPWSALVPLPTVPLEATLQALVEDQPGVFRVSNALLVRVL